jgi:hypothetical protein
MRDALNRVRTGWLLLACVLWMPAFSGEAAAQNTASIKPKQPVTATACKPEPGKQYFVEFRSRTAASYGHSFVFFGKLAGPGKFGKFQVAGLHPRGDDPEVYMQGHVIPVPSETGASYGDLDEQYMTARYCVVLTEAEYNKLASFIRGLQARSTEWHAPTKNCNWFIGEIASSTGLTAPPSHILLPEHYVSLMKDLNSGKTSLSASSTSAGLMPKWSWPTR